MLSFQVVTRRADTLDSLFKSKIVACYGKNAFTSWEPSRRLWLKNQCFDYRRQASCNIVKSLLHLRPALSLDYHEPQALVTREKLIQTPRGYIKELSSLYMSLSHRDRIRCLRILALDCSTFTDDYTTVELQSSTRKRNFETIEINILKNIWMNEIGSSLLQWRGIEDS